MYPESDLLPISALQHLAFCERQCALIHIEQVWTENQFTAEGRALHKRTHSQHAETRGGVHTERGMPVRSLELGLAGMTDVVEFDENGVPFPVEYKRGRPKKGKMDEIQLCAEAICLEEMLGKAIPEGALFYGKIKRRKTIRFDEELRALTRAGALRLRELLSSGTTPPPVYGAKCKRCSLIENCLPKIFSRDKKVGLYVSRMLEKPIGEDTEATE
ncbi:MAG: CRISPR-associated protein Cas4 [Spirochaetales bacterium]|nr:CRISPR-associated protein Cas4 [Spirochaetales bacterium]